MASQPTKIGKYDIVRVIGRGGMGMVYQAIDPTIGRMVAIKRVTSVLSDDPELLKRFYREAKSTGQLQHPNIVTLYGLGDQDGVPYLVMEYLEGDSLEKIIREHRPYTMAEKLNVIIQACEGLAYAHQRHIIHRDVKPGNIVVLNDGGVKIVDFGIAQLGNERFTRTGQVVGSLYYMSPEQIQDADVDSRSDIYSIGVVLFEFLSGSLPFQGKDPTSTLAKILNDPPPSLAKFVALYPSELDEVLRRALCRDRNERYTSMEDLLFDLRTMQEKLSRELITNGLRAAENCIASRDWERAREQLRQVLSLDKQHRRANELLREVHAQVQRQQVGEQVKQLRMRADEALSMRNWDEALKLLEQAVKLDANNTELVEFCESVRRSTAMLVQSLRRAEAAHDAGDLDAAKQAVEQALSVDPANTTAKALNAILSKEISERSKRKRVDEFVVGARKELALRHFTSALELLRGAEAIDPSLAEVQQLIRSATAGRENERRRLALEKACTEIEDLLHRDQYIEACEKADEALQSFPQELGLLKLKGFAEKQRDAWSRHQFIESQMASARQLFESGQLLKAQSVLNEAIERYPDDSELVSLLGIVTDGLARQDAQRREAERQANERRRYIRSQLEAAADLQQSGRTLEALKKIREGMFHYPDSEEFKSQIMALEAVLAREEAARQRAEQEARQRKAEIEKLIADTWQLLSKNQTSEAIGVLEQALRRYPQNEDLKSQLEFANRRLAVERAERERIEQEVRRRRGEIQNELAGAQQLLEARQASRAVAALEQALSRNSDSEELRSLLQEAQRRQAVEQAERERAEKQARQRLAEIEQVIMTARQLLDAKRTKESVECLEQALRRYPGSEELRLPVEYARQRLAAEEAARERAAEEERRRRAWIDSEIAMACQWLDDKQAARAVSSLQQALLQYPESPELRAQLEIAQRRLAVEHVERERAEQEARRRREAIDREIAAGRELMEAKKNDQAAASLEKALFQYPDSKELRLQFEMATRRLEEEEAEKRRIAEEQRRKKEEIERELQSATQLLNSRQTLRAVSSLETVFLKYPDSTALKSQLEIARRRLGEEQAEREKAAQEALRKQQEIEKEMMMAKILLDSGKTSQAVANLQESVRRLPDSEQLKLQLDFAEKRLADEEAARKRTEEENRRRRTAIANAVSIAQQLMDSHQTERAVTTLEQALRSYPESNELKTQFVEAQNRWAAERAERERVEAEARRRQAEIGKEIKAAGQLLDSQLTSQAITTLEAAVERFPESKELETVLDSARQRLARELEEKRQAEEQARRRKAEIESQIALGRQSLDSSQTSQAFAQLEEATRKYSESEELRSLLNEARERLGRERAEQERAEREAQSRRQRIAVEIDSAKRLLNAKDTVRAVTGLEEAVRSYPETDELRSLLATGKEQQAREAAEREQAEKRRAQIEAQKKKTRSFLDAGKPDQALRTVEAALQAFGKEAELQQLRKSAKAAVQKVAQQKNEEEKKRAAEREQAEEQRRRRERALADLRKLGTSLSSGAKPSAVEKSIQKAKAIAAPYREDREIQQVLIETENALRPLLAQPASKPKPAENFLATRVFVPGRPEPAAEAPEAAVEAPIPTTAITPASLLPKLLNKWTAIAVGAVLVVALAVIFWPRSPAVVTPKVYSVSFESNPSGAVVQVGDQKCVTPKCSLSLPAGEYQVQAELPDYLPLTQSIVIDAKKPVDRIVLDLVPKQTAGYLVVRAGIAGASISANGKRYGQTNSEGTLRVPLEPGPYKVEIQKKGYQAVSPQQVLITKGNDIAADFKLTPLPSQAELLITGAPPNVLVQLDGRGLGLTGNDGVFLQFVEPGDHQIVLVQSGQKSNAIHQRLKANQRFSLDGKRFIISAPPPPSMADVVITNLSHVATVRVDGGETHHPDGFGTARFEMSTGDHVLEISGPGFTPKRIQRSFAKGENSLDGTLERIDSEKQQYEASYQRALQQYQHASDKRSLEAARESFQLIAQSGGTHAGEARMALEDVDKRIAALNPLPQLPQPPKTSKERDETAIRALINRYEQAFDARDADALLKIWPNMGSKTYNKQKSTFAAVSAFHMQVDLESIDISGKGKTGTVNVILSQAFTLKGGGNTQTKLHKDRAVFDLTKSNGTWTINNIR